MHPHVESPASKKRQGLIVKKEVVVERRKRGKESPCGSQAHGAEIPPPRVCSPTGWKGSEEARQTRRGSG
jgi:hypothetical protein